jgi:hypothetical protein
MRLTLRTLLAWLDDAPMSQAQRKELKEKVVSSESARKLLEHLKSVEGNRQIVAPQLDGQGSKDANTTSEYLDGELEEALVAQFEKSCLESDSLLAEVAGCHAALAAILRQDKARITSSMRERAYKLGRVISKSFGTASLADSSDSSVSHGTDEEMFVDRKLDSDSQFDLSPPDEEADGKVSSFMEHLQQDLEGIAEEDLHAKGKHNGTNSTSALSRIVLVLVAAVVLLAAGIGIGIWMQTDKNDSLADGDNDQSDTSAVNDANGKSDQTDPDTNNQNRSETDSAGNSSDDADSATNNGTSAAGSSEKANSNAPTTNENGATSKTDADNSSSEISRDATDLNSDKTESRSESDGNSIVKHQPSDLPPSPNQPVFDAPKSDGGGAADDAAVASMPDRAQWPVTQIPPGEVAGIVGKESQLLLRKTDSNWQVLGVDAEIHQGDVLFAPMGFKPEISFPTANVQLIGPARVTVGPPQSENANVHLFVYSGTVTLQPALEAGDGIRLTLGEHQGKLVFIDRASVITVSVDRDTEIRNETFYEKMVNVKLTAANNRALWEDENKVWTIDPTKVIEYAGLEPAKEIPVTGPVDWLPGELSKIDIDAAVNIHNEMSDGINPITVFENFLTDARIENRYLAARALVSLQKFKGAFQILDDRTNRTYWTKMLDDVREETLKFEPSATAMQTYLKSDPDGELITKMVLGFDNEQLKAGEDGRLVAALSHPRLLIRVLAIENLRRITGSTYLYRPDSLEKTRLSNVRKWRRQLDQGEIRHPVESP